MVERGSQTSFRESISGAPEFSQPFIARTIFGTQEWPFVEIKPEVSNGISREIVIFEANGLPSPETDPLKIRVSYEEPYGLKVKRQVISRKYGDEFLMCSASVRYSFEDLDIVLVCQLNSDIVIESMYRDPSEFQASILVESRQGTQSQPPLAYMVYELGKHVPIHAEFPCADYQEALIGNVDARETGGRASYKKTYFQWEDLVGAKAGVARYDNPEHETWLNYYAWQTIINGREPKQLEGEIYKQKISRSPSPRREGRLRFSRMNIETGESWMLSVPEFIDIEDFHRNSQHETLRDFSWRYPIIFCVKRRGEEKIWYSTWGQRDQGRLRTRKLLNLQEPQRT